MKKDSQLKWLMLGLALLLGSAAADESLVVTTEGGELRGTTLKSFLGNDIFSFKGKIRSIDMGIDRYGIDISIDRYGIDRDGRLRCM